MRVVDGLATVHYFCLVMFVLLDITITRASSLIRINAIYSNATWHHQFNVKTTSERDFFMESGHAVPVRMMTKILNLKTCENIPLLNAGVCQLP
jgi:serine protease inhibitor